MTKITKHILVATDSLIQRRILVNVLRDFGCNVNISSSGLDVVSTVLQELNNNSPFDVVILDMQQGGMKSIQALKGLRSNTQTKDIKIILLISQAQESTVTGLESLGYEGYLVKPIWRESLQQKLDQLCASDALDDESSLPVDILVADDDELNQQMLTILLEKKGYKVQAVSDGTDALEAILGWHFGLAILDVHMPTMSGYEVTENIREWEAGRMHLPIIALTASSTPDEIGQFANIGMDAYLLKPLDQKALFALMDQYLNSQPSTFADTKNLPRDFDVIETLKYQSALPRFGNDTGQYSQLLAQFVLTFPDRASKIQGALQGGDEKAALDAAHSLKGVSANLGALKLSALAQDLEDKLHEQDKNIANQILVDIIEEVKSLAKKIKEVFGIDISG